MAKPAAIPRAGEPRIEARVRPGPPQRDYQAVVPVYRYLLACGHTVRYRHRVEQLGYGWCRQCRRQWRFIDGRVRELAPTIPRQRSLRAARGSRGRPYSEGEVALLRDEAILRSRIAERTVRGPWEAPWTVGRVKALAKEFAPALSALYRAQDPGDPCLAGLGRRPNPVTVVQGVLADHGIARDRDCSLEGCRAWQHADGLCEAHYRAARRSAVKLAAAA